MQTIAYNTSKGAVINFTRALGCEWGQSRHHGQRDLPRLLPEQDDRRHARSAWARNWPPKRPLRRLGDDEDLKGLALLFASDAGKHITGQWMAVDGGVSVVTGG